MVVERRDFDLEAFLARPLVGRLATCGEAGPTVRPIWFLWEDGAFWWLTGRWSALADHLDHDRRVAIVVDTCELATGQTLQVRATGRAEIHPYDAYRAHRKLTRYLGPDPTGWAPRFRTDTSQEPRFVRLVPDHLDAVDLSYEVRT